MEGGIFSNNTIGDSSAEDIYGGFIFTNVLELRNVNMDGNSVVSTDQTVPRFFST